MLNKYSKVQIVHSNINTSNILILTAVGFVKSGSSVFEKAIAEHTITTTGTTMMVM